jgi:hypothetical protein
MALVSMKQEKEMGTEIEDNPYGYGLCIRLSPEQCTALGITTPPPAGSVMMLTARAEAKRVTEEAEEDGNEIYLELQITDMELQGMQTDPLDAARVIYNAAQPYVKPGPTSQIVNPMTMSRLG